MRGRGKSRRPVISEPFGPVKTSRGSDLIRSDTLIIVDSIKDCESNSSDSPLEREFSLPMQTLRRVSVGIQDDGPLASSPTVARSDIMATPIIETPSHQKASKKPRKSLLSTSSILKPPFKTVSSTTLLLKPSTAPQDENIPPSHDGLVCPASPEPHPVSKLPKSRTMTALHDLKTSISRPSLAVRSINSASFSASARKTSSSSTTTPPVIPSSSSRLRLPRSSMASLTKSSRSCTPEPQPMHISTAQSSAYWSGRFVALHDRFSSENLALEASRSSSVTAQLLTSQLQASAKTPYTTLYQRTSHLPHSTTTSALRTITRAPAAPAISEDDARCRRVFVHLDSLCTTSESRRSLHIWQQAYARRHGRPSLLPEGGSMEDKGLMAKIFGDRGKRKGERRSFGALRQASNNRGGKSILSESIPSISRTKRLTLS